MTRTCLRLALLWAASSCVSAHDCSVTDHCQSSQEPLQLEGEMVLKDPPVTIDNTAYRRMSSLIDFINNKLSFSSNITVRVDVDDGPLYDPATDEIWMPPAFGDGIAYMFSGDDTLDSEEQQEIIEDVLLHTLVHEAGHALFAQVDIPLLAREEDAVDALASVLLLEFHERGDEVVLNAAEMFGLESDSVEWFEAADFWGEHSLDIQRYYTSICHVYGSDSDANEELINDEYGLSEERAEACIDEYALLRDGWLRVLTPYLKES